MWVYDDGIVKGIRWTPVLSNRFDTTAFKKHYGELYKAFTKQTASRRFTISA